MPATPRFVARVAEADGVVFENLSHDFPQRISDRRNGPETLLARIEGTRDGVLRVVNFAMRRSACERSRCEYERPGALNGPSLAGRLRQLRRTLLVCMALCAAPVLAQPQPQSAALPLEWQALRQAGALKAAGNCDAARPLLDQALTLRPTLAQGLHWRAECHAAAGRHDQAERDYKQLLSVWPADPMALGNLGGALLKLGRLDEAEAALRQSWQLNPMDAAMPWFLALVDSLRGHREAARALFRQSLALLPADRFLPVLMADITALRAQRRWPAALDDTEAWLSTENLRFAPQRALAAAAPAASALFAQRRWREAAQAFGALAERGETVFAAQPVLVHNWRGWQALAWMELDDFDQAEPLLQRVARDVEASLGATHPLLLSAHNNLAELHKRRGRFAEAEALLLRNVQLNQHLQGPQHPSTATAQLNLGALYARVGAYARAEPLLAQALQVHEAQSGPLDPRTLNLLNNLGVMEDGRGNAAAAMAHYHRALAMARLAVPPDAALQTRVTVNLALNRHEAGARDEAAAAYRQAQGLLVQAGRDDSADAAALALNHALLLRQNGDAAAAEELLRRGLLTALQRGDAQAEWNALAGLHALRSGNDSIALGKLSVAVIQRLRRGATGLAGDLQRAWLVDKGDVFRSVAEQLAAARRVAEALELVTLLKDDELREQLPEGAATAPVTMSGPEAGWALAYQSLQRRAADASVPMQTLRGELAAFLDRVRAESRQPIAPGPAVLARVRALQRSLAGTSDEPAAEPGRVLLHVLVQPSQVLLLLTSASQQVLRSTQLPAARLNGMVDTLRSALQQPASDPRPAAQALYQVLLAPLAADLERLGATSLLLSLDGRLRYVPIAALHDGERYVLQRWQVAQLSAAAADTTRATATAPRADWRVAAFGLTQASTVQAGFPTETVRFGALPAVARELQAITAAAGAALPGTALRDAQFDRAAIHAALARRTPVLHFATHFAFRPGPADASFLVLGDGTALGMGALLQNPGWRGTQVLVLSACETAVGGMGGARNADGREVDSLAAQARLRGVGTVVASLWKVADDSTAALMAAFYRRLAAGDGVAQALRAAQLLLLRAGAAATVPEGAERGAAAVVPQASGALRQPVQGQAHPYHWAPFTVTGKAD